MIRPVHPIGRLTSLGSQRDLRDAAAVLATAVACTSQLSHTPSGSAKVFREASYHFWERPRLPGPLVASKYPREFPWSPSARALVAPGSRRPVGGWGLVLDHALPVSLLRLQVFAHVNSLDPASLITVLNKHLAYAVISKDPDDRDLTACGLRHRLPDGAGPGEVWARYECIGLTANSFARLSDL